jgi:hypothetical protein
MWWMLSASAFGALVVLFMLGRRNENAVRRDWDTLLTPKGEKLYHAIENRFRVELALAEMTYEDAFSVRELGSTEEAMHLLDVGYKAIERFSPDMLKLLSAMTTFSRMVSAMAPVRPLRPADFKLSQLTSLAHLNRILHQFVVSTSERYRLRLYIIGRGFGLAGRQLMKSTKRIVDNEPDAALEWQQIRAIRHDFQTLTDESLESLRVLLTSLAAERKDVYQKLIV